MGITESIGFKISTKEAGKMPVWSFIFPRSHPLPTVPTSSTSSPLLNRRSPGWSPLKAYNAIAYGFPELASAFSCEREGLDSSIFTWLAGNIPTLPSNCPSSQFSSIRRSSMMETPGLKLSSCLLWPSNAYCARAQGIRRLLAISVTPIAHG